MENGVIDASKPDVITQVGRKGATNSLFVSPNTNDGGLLAQLSSNPVFAGGLGLAGFGALLAFAQRGLRRGAGLLQRRLLVDLEINNKDESYPWFLYWMTAHQRGQMPGLPASPAGGDLGRQGIIGSLLNRVTPRTHHLAIETQKILHANGSVQTRFFLVPGPGRHVLRYKNAFLMVNRVREIKSMDFHKGTPWETITLTTLFSNRGIFEDLFIEAHRLAQQSTEGKTIVYTARTASWEKFGDPRRKRPLESVILDKDVKERIVSDVRDFLGSGKWYYDRGIPYRRGYLLYGPPGTGKTSFIEALAGELDYNIAMLNMSERGMTDDRLSYLLSIIPPRTLVLLEDADAAFPIRRAQSDAHGYQGANVTFSGLLNAMDGVASAEERVIFLTTNYIDRLDSALIRPGRIDMTIRLGEATRWQTERLWDRFYGDVDEQGQLRERFLTHLEQLGFIENSNGEKPASGKRTSAAALQGLFLYNKGNPEGAISMAEAVLPQPMEEASISRPGPAPAQIK